MVYDFDNNNKLLSYATCNIWFEYCVDIEMVQTQVLKTCEVLIIYNNLQLFV